MGVGLCSLVIGGGWTGSVWSESSSSRGDSISREFRDWGSDDGCLVGEPLEDGASILPGDESRFK